MTAAGWALLFDAFVPAAGRLRPNAEAIIYPEARAIVAVPDIDDDELDRIVPSGEGEYPTCPAWCTCGPNHPVEPDGLGWVPRIHLSAPQQPDHRYRWRMRDAVLGDNSVVVLDSDRLPVHWRERRRFGS